MTEPGAAASLPFLRRAVAAARSRLGLPPETGRPEVSNAGRAERSRYESTWSPPDETEARRLIYLTDSEERFDEGGRADFARLEPWLDEGATALDLGCGIGRVARHVAPACGTLWAVDVSERMLEMAAQRMSDLSNVRYVHSEDVAIPEVPTHSVDLAYSFLVLQHVEREDAFLLLEELHRLVKPGGTVVLTYPNLLSDGYLESFMHYAHNRCSGEPARARMYTPQEVDRLVSAAGFSPEIEAETEIRVVARPV